MRTVALALALSIGCSSSSRSEPTVVNVGVGVHVHFDGPIESLPFDPHEERLRAATEQVEALLGHPVELEIDTALLPQYRHGFEEALIHALESIARDARTLNERDPDAFAYGKDVLEWIRCRYDAAATRPSSELDTGKKSLVVTLPPDSGELVPDGTVYRALEDAYDRYQEGRWANATPDSVPASEHARYFRFLTGYRRFGPRSADLDEPGGYVSDPRAETLLRVTRLAALTRDRKLARALDEHLVREARYFTGAYVNHPNLVTRAPKDGSFHRAEAAWVRWLTARYDGLDDAAKLEVAKTIFVRMYNRDVATYGRFADFAFPGIDPFAFGVKIIDEWIRARHPVELPENRERGLLYEHIVCPHPVDEQRQSRSRGPRCDYDFYELALSQPGGIERLAGVLVQRNDDRLTEFAFVNVIYKGTIEDILRLWRAVEWVERTWTTATRVLAEEAAHGHGDALLDESRRLWRTHPKRRGQLLYLLALVDRYDNGRVPWKDLPKSFGAAITATEFASFLDQGHRALSTAAVVWPALGDGWSRAQAIVPRLSGYLGDPRVRTFHERHPWLAVREIVNRLCAEKATDDLALLHIALSQRAEQRPSEQSALENLIEDTRPGACRR